MKRTALMAVCFALWIQSSNAIEIEPLKSVYHSRQLSDVSSNDKYVYRFTRTRLSETGFSVICDMGKAVPDSEDEDAYSNQPMPGLRIELRARAMVRHSYDGEPLYYNTGFVVVVKDGAVTKSFDPPKPWFLPWWSNSKNDIYLRDWPPTGKADSLNFDLLSGNGLYHKDGSTKASHFLSNCRKITKQKLPVYTRERVTS